MMLLVNEHSDIVVRKFRTGFQFMANKQYRIEKILGTTVYADISQHALKKSLDTFFWMTIFFFCRFLEQIRLKKTFFRLTLKKTVFLQYNN